MIVEELHWSALKYMGRSPAHFLAYVRGELDTTRPMVLGTLAHAIILGGAFVLYDGERRGNAWKEFAAENEGKLIVTPKEQDAAMRIASAVMRDPIAAPLLKGRRERAWKTTLYGRACGGCIDVSGKGFTADVKTTGDAQPDRFRQQCLRQAYHSQASFYADARRALGENPGESFIIGVETKPPYAVTVVHLTEGALAEGRKLTTLWMNQLAVCEATGKWPPYVQSAVDLDVSPDLPITFDGVDLFSDAS